MTASQTRSTETAPMQREIEITRLFDVPVDLVYAAWTEPRHVINWWGPHGFTNPECEMDVRSGGIWRIVMRGPDGVDFPSVFTYTEVVPGVRIVFKQHVEFNGVHVLDGLTSVTFAAEGKKTRLTVNSRSTAVVEMAAMMLQGMYIGWTQTVDRLQVLVESGSPTLGREIQGSRLLNAPRDLVFRMFTDPEHVGNWWGPKGFSLTNEKMDVRPGGVWQFVMHGPDGRDYANRNIYREIVEPKLLVMEHDSTPKFVMTIRLLEQQDKTWLSWHMLFDTIEQRDLTANTFGAVEGLQQTLGRLEELVNAQSA